MKHLWKVLSVLLALAMLPFATASASESVKIGVIYTVAGLGGASFNDVIHEGCQRAEKELGITYEYVEPSTIADEETVMDEMCISGEYALIICVGNEQKDAVSTVAANYPDQKFCYIDASVDLPNVANYECKGRSKSDVQCGEKIWLSGRREQCDHQSFCCRFPGWRTLY